MVGQAKWIIQFTGWYQGYRQQQRLTSSCRLAFSSHFISARFVSSHRVSWPLTSHFPRFVSFTLSFPCPHYFPLPSSLRLFFLFCSSHFLSSCLLISSCLILPRLSPLLSSPLLSRLSQAAALSDRRHRLGDESLRLRSIKSQTSWCGCYWYLGICCSFSNGSIRQIDLPFISSICGRVSVVCMCVMCVSEWEI